MLIQTILNKCHKFKSFVYRDARMLEQGSHPTIEVDIVPRANSKPVCSGCNQPAPSYDKRDIRRFEFIPMWGFSVFLCYQMRRVNCHQCGIKIESVPWANGKHQSTKVHMQFLAHWSKQLSWKAVSEAFNTSWDRVFRAVEYTVGWGLKHRDLSHITAIGVDEVACRKGHHYLTLVYQIDAGATRLLWIGEKRTQATLDAFFDWFGDKNQQLEYVCSDMWKAYLNVIQNRASQALNILDRFHIVAKLNKAIDEVRAAERRQMIQDQYEPLLKHSRWCLLKRPENLTEKQEAKLSTLLKYNLKSVRAYLLKEDFDGFWQYTSAYHAGNYLDRWCNRTMRSKIEPMKKVAKTIRNHRDLILNWFKANKAYSSGIVEGLNTKVKLTVRKSYGFKSYKCTEIALYHSLGKLPEPKLTHRFY